MGQEGIGMLRAIEVLKSRINLRLRLSLRRVARFQQGKSLFVHKRERRADAALGHGSVQGVLWWLEGVRGAIVAVDAVHHALFAVDGCGYIGRNEICRATVCVPFAYPWNYLALPVGGDVLDMT